MLGSRSSCPSSIVTLKNGVQNLHQLYIPEKVSAKPVKDEVETITEEEFSRFEKQIRQKDGADADKTSS
uniref:Uncharacterized protein n=1 Tax=Anopheles atroparvus TaxID=41427 RepID=A0A182ITS9_ANOAO